MYLTRMVVSKEARTLRNVDTSTTLLSYGSSLCSPPLDQEHSPNDDGPDVLIFLRNSRFSIHNKEIIGSPTLGARLDADTEKIRKLCDILELTLRRANLCQRRITRPTSGK